MLINVNMPRATVAAKLTALGVGGAPYLFAASNPANPLWDWLKDPWRRETQYLLVITPTALKLWPLVARGIAGTTPTVWPLTAIHDVALTPTALSFRVDDETRHFGVCHGAGQNPALDQFRTQLTATSR